MQFNQRMSPLARTSPIFTGGQGIGASGSSPAFKLLQHGTNFDSVAAGAVSKTYGKTTKAGSLLLAMVGCYNSATPTITPPAGWTQANTVSAVHLTTTGTLWLYYWANATPQTGTGAFTFNGDAHGAGIIVAEYAGMLASPLDKTQSNSAYSSANPSTGTTGTTTQASELVIGCLMSVGTGLWGAPTSGFTQVDAVSDTVNDYEMLSLKASAPGTFTTSDTGTGGLAIWCGLIATFII
jgi:hypothetical protein